MKIKPYIDKLHNSKQFKEFKKKHSRSFMAAGFFVMDYETGKNMHQIDYYVPSQNKVAAFTLDGGVSVQILNMMHGGKAPQELDMNTRIDLDALKGILQDEMKNRSITDDIKKVIAIIQNIDGKKIWNLNCVLTGMGILRAHVDDDSKSVLKMEKVSMMDYIQKIPGNKLQKMMANKGQMPGPVNVQSAGAGGGDMAQPVNANEDGEIDGGEIAQKKPSREDAKEQIKKLEMIKQAVEKEEALLREKSGIGGSESGKSGAVKLKTVKKVVSKTKKK